MTSLQKKYLRGLAHELNPVVLIGNNGLTETLVKSINEQLSAHELIKIKFIAFKEKQTKEAFCDEIKANTASELVATIGHCAILYRQQNDADKRKIVLPSKRKAVSMTNKSANNRAQNTGLEA